ncbi:sensor histidine kinase [Trueperella sp. LYQ141]|uniref:sensor histidine kinase n=1 Tax=Trueperella sp. LYQ141 TaxID=3391058 RepID=UPI0039830830
MNTIRHGTITDLIEISDMLHWSENPVTSWDNAISILKSLTGAKLAPTYLLDLSKTRLVLLRDKQAHLLPAGFETMPAWMHVRPPWINEREWPVSARSLIGSQAWEIFPQRFRDWFSESGIVLPLCADGRHLGAVLLTFDDQYDMDEEQARFFAATGRILGQFVYAWQTRERNREIGALVERRRMGDELHADISQDLAALGLALETLDIDAQECDCSGLDEDIIRLKTMLQEAQQGLRSLMLGLRRDANMIDGNFIDVVRERLNALAQRTDVQTALNVTGNRQNSIPLAIASPLARVLRESLNNILLHANAHRVDVTLDCSATRIVMQVIDDGVGFDVQAIEGARLGLQIMKERVDQIHGQFRVSSAAGQGTTVFVSVPLLYEEGLTR